MDNKFKKPWICLLSLTDGNKIVLDQKFETVYNGSIGSPVRADYQSSYCTFLLNFDFPKNIHEYDLFVVNMLNNDILDYQYSDHTRANSRSKNDYFLYTEHPQKVFDPRSYALKLFYKAIDKKGKKSLVITFAGERELTDYSGRDFSASYGSPNLSTISNYKRLESFFNIRNKFGTEISIAPSEFKRLFDQHLEGFQYHTTFEPSLDMIEQNELNYLPLIHNADGEVISFLLEGDKDTFLVLPAIADQAGFLDELLSTILPDRYPDLFPFSDKNNWLNQSAYHLPNHRKLLEERQELERKYNDDRLLVDRRIDDNISQFKFLHSLLNATDNELVEALIKYFEWLGIEKIVDKDQTAGNLKEEDLQLIHGNRLLIVEVKGIGGTSKDDECSQIAKVRFRRMRELKRTDVYALYIVNHQRHLPPMSRNNPPFQEQQIIDAEEDSRGLLTTWELFRAFEYVVDGILTKEDIIHHLYDTGLIRLKPTLSYTCIGRPKELFQRGEVVIIDLNGTLIKVGDQVLISSNDDYKLVEVISIRLDEEEVSEAANGEAGIRLHGRVKEADQLWIKRK